MSYAIFIILIAILLIVILTVSIINENKKLKFKLTNSFGKVPSSSDYELKSIEDYHCCKSGFAESPGSIDNITWSDLDMDKVFRRINVCLTSIGEEYLYEVLHEPNFKSDKLQKREKLIDYLKTNPDERIKLQVLLSKFGKLNYNGLSSFIFNANSKSLKYPNLYKILAVVPLLSIAIMILNLYAGLFCLVMSAIVNMVVYYMSKRNIDAEMTAINYFSSMLWCCNKVCKMKSSELSPFMADLEKEFDVFKSLRGKTSGIMQKSLSDMDFISEYAKIISLSDLRHYNETIHRISKNSDSFHELYKNVGEIDLAICILSFRESLPFYSMPHFNEEKDIHFSDLYHPLLEQPITNSGILKNDSIVTGSNASGKSTFIKALAVNGILAQTIYTCAAKEYNTRFALVITSMAVRDNITEGDSYFITEIKSLKRILDKVKILNCFCFIDEILKGTNTIERIAASASVLGYLHDMDCLCIVASHDIELTEILKNEYDNYHFCEQITDAGIHFDYKLKQGASQTSNAIKLLHYMNFDNRVVENAENLVGKFILTKKW